MTSSSGRGSRPILTCYQKGVLLINVGWERKTQIEWSEEVRALYGDIIVFLQLCYQHLIFGLPVPGYGSGSVKKQLCEWHLRIFG